MLHVSLSGPGAAAVMLGEVTERAFQGQVLELAAVFGWRAFHPHDSRGSQRGFPDLSLVRGGRLVFAELKSEVGRVRPEQREWLAALAGVGGGVEAFLWRPSDLGSIVAVLR